VGNALVADPLFDWDGDEFHLPAVNELVIYELHLGTFYDDEDGKSDKFAEAVQKLGHLQRLGVNVIEVMLGGGRFANKCNGSPNWRGVPSTSPMTVRRSTGSYRAYSIPQT
jgi:hypothetical protein